MFAGLIRFLITAAVLPACAEEVAAAAEPAVEAAPVEEAVEEVIEAADDETPVSEAE